jgi:signal transduction histidine kinase
VLAIVPCLIFDTTERVSLYGTLSLIFFTLLLFDPVHELFGVGYYQRGFTGSSYYTINYFTIICFLALVAGVLSQKKVIEDTERLNQRIKNDLIVKNKELQVTMNDLKMQNEEVHSQNEHITHQREELYASQEQLQSANLLIEKQKAELQRQVNHISLNLKGANEELIKQNNNLRQFSYAISHNLRGPIARLMGLAYLAELESGLHKNGMSSMIIDHLKTSAGELDSVIHDLNEVIDLQNAVDQLRRPVDFATSWNEIKLLLRISDEMEREHFSIDFSLAPSVISVKPMINSILFSLVSNTIKYQDPERPLQVRISTDRSVSYTTLEVKDNGLGINLKRFRKDIFKLYKRFHYHQEGKGLGLYLVKTQVEALNGYVDVDSEPGKGSSFRIYIKDPPAQTVTDQASQSAALLS